MARAGHKPNTGQEIRLADIESDAGTGMGAFETLNGQPTPAVLAQALKDAVSRSYGTVGMEWLRRIVEHRTEIKGEIDDRIRAFVSATVPEGAAGQAERVARRFGLTAVAGELTTRFGLTGWREGEASTAAGTCFAAWLEGFGGTGNREERAMLAQVKAFFEAYGSSRFEHWRSSAEQRIPSRAGFVKFPSEESEYFQQSR